MYARSLRKSSCHAGTQARLAVAEAARRDIPARLDGLFADALAQQAIGVVEILEKLGEERVTVRGDGLLDTLEDAAIDAFRILRRLQEEGRNAEK